MPKYSDAFHPPHARWTAEEPRTKIDIGPSAIRVSLTAWGPREGLFTSIYDSLVANWGEHAYLTGERPCPYSSVAESGKWTSDIDTHQRIWEHITGWCQLQEREQAYVEKCFAGQTLQQILELITFKFTVENVTRAFTHEFVRARIGAGFMQHGGRDNDWRHRNWTMTEAMERMCQASEMNAVEWANQGKLHPITDWSPIERYLDRHASNYDYTRKDANIRDAIETHLEDGKRLYAALVDAGIPWQDARRLLPIGCQTYIHGEFNYVAVKGWLMNRLEHVMDWEINCVAQLMLREIRMQCPPILSKYLGSHSDLAKRAMFDQMESWPPDGKFPSTTIRCATCGHHEANHFLYHGTIKDKLLPDEMVCEVCEREHGTAPMHRFVPEDTLPRSHRSEQMPFFVLHPDSMNGGPIKWLWTNGHYQDIQSQLKGDNDAK